MGARTRAIRNFKKLSPLDFISALAILFSYIMANTKSAAKQARVSLRRKTLNKATKTKIKDVSKEFKSLVASGDKAGAAKLLGKVQSELDKGAKKNTIHPNKASRLKAQAARLVK
ncbi:MAG: 30S ribosomal protein S20 [Blastochloris sp.]|nr:30S ribosomal protein S20 [Blastochloris sp.]